MGEQYKMPKWAVGQVTRASGLVEDTCRHGISHPNKEWLAKNDPEDKKGFAIHGCDGCCKPNNKTLELSDEMVKAIERAKQRIQKGQSVNEKKAKEKLGLKSLTGKGDLIDFNRF